MTVDKIKLLVDLVQTKVEILKLKADDYTWACYVDDKTKNDLENALLQIDALIIELR